MTALTLNRRLAELLGWSNIIELGGALLGTPPAGEPQCRNQALVPNWAGDWRDCGPLMVVNLYEIKITPDWIAARAICHCDIARKVSSEEAPDETARRAIVAAVIAKLEVSQ